MSTPTVQNLEEAATIASEFIATLENIPSEVQFLLQELRTKETQSQELQQEIAKDSHKFIRHALRADSEALGKDKPSPPPPTEKIKQAQKTLATLADEKIALAERIVEILSRKRSRLDYDLGRVLVLQGEPDPAAIVAGAAPPILSVGSGGAPGGSGYVLGGRNPAAHINESLRNAFAGGTALPVASSGSKARTRVSVSYAAFAACHDLYAVERKLNAMQGSIKLPSPAPSLYVPATGRGRRKKRGVSSEVDDFDFDFGEETQAAEDVEGDEGEGEGEEGDDGEDKELYCFCQKLSYGEMIACDNPDCPYQWFHLPCVNLKQPLPERWFCAECTKRGMGAPATSGPGRKGRKK
ncbi:hypothetical protein HYDPIDRAFT_78556 [Hydnomerulius pinastri MD-312]|nr:hypothetical protein HYDPIDRAFT_78556 [Hydnomerulius pinastri MD-312]